MFESTHDDDNDFEGLIIPPEFNDADDTLSLDHAFNNTGIDSDEIDERDARRKPNRTEKRISKLVYERNTLKQQNDDLERRLTQLEEKASKLDEQHSSNSYETQRGDLLEQLRIARAAEDIDEEQSIQEKLTSLYVDKSRSRKDPNETASNNEPAPKKQDEPYYSPLAYQWLEKNPWAQQGNNFRVVNDIYQKIQNEGFNVDDPETYEELSSRVRQAANKRPQQAAGISDQDHVSTRRAGSQFTDEDRRSMRRIGLDPDNKLERTEFLLQKAKYNRSRNNGEI